MFLLKFIKTLHNFWNFKKSIHSMIKDFLHGCLSIAPILRYKSARRPQLRLGMSFGVNLGNEASGLIVPPSRDDLVLLSPEPQASG